ncbi:MAG: hypothetical protein ACLQPD_08040 [Desulfomonilaceae bacterium]
MWPYSMCGETSWANYRLICGSCNTEKRDFIDQQIHQFLGKGEFRGRIATYLRELISRGILQDHVILQELLGQTE